MSDPSAAPWTTNHTLHLIAQTQSRPTPAADAQGDHWMEHRPTGLAIAVCNCGYTTGWIPKDQLPSLGQLIARHSPPTTTQP